METIQLALTQTPDTLGNQRCHKGSELSMAQFQTCQQDNGQSATSPHLFRH